MIRMLRFLASVIWHGGIVRDATASEDACESCPDSLAIHCTGEQAATCETRLAAVEQQRKDVT